MLLRCSLLTVVVVMVHGIHVLVLADVSTRIDATRKVTLKHNAYTGESL